MIYYAGGDIFNSSAQSIIIPVNTSGIAKTEIAIRFKDIYPSAYERYKTACKSGFKPGQLFMIKGETHNLLCVATKQDWRSRPKISTIREILQNLQKGYEKQGITGIAIPRIGCGPGSLWWEQVCPLIEQYLSTLPIDVFVYSEGEKNYEDQNNEKPVISA